MLGFLGSFAVVFGKELSLSGTTQTLPASDPRNQYLLHLPDHIISDTAASVANAFEQNRLIEPQIERMVSIPYFATYKVDLSDSRCPLDADTAMCANRQCVIEPLTSHLIDPQLFEQQYLGRLRKDSVSLEAPEQVQAEGCTPEQASLFNERSGHKDYCYPEDERLAANGVYVDLRGNAERYTGYDGPHASLMWEKVYAENCFGYYGEHPPQNRELADVFAHPKHDNTVVPLAEECVEQRLFYKLLSGMHASISTHLTYDYLNSTTNTWGTNFEEWLERVGWHQDRLDNLFFDYVLMSRAVAKLTQIYEPQLLFSAPCQSVDADVRIAIRRLGRLLRNSPLAAAIDEGGLFSTASPAQNLKQEFRQRVRNVNALMSCVGCERCRLWGKIQTAGYGTALKILFELPSDPQQDPESVAEVLGEFRRSELVALINTFARISHSVAVTYEFYLQSENALVDKASVRYNWNLALSETRNALRHIGQSYIDLPKNLWIIANYYGRIAWGKLIGNAHQPNFNQGFHVEL